MRRKVTTTVGMMLIFSSILFAFDDSADLSREGNEAEADAANASVTKRPPIQQNENRSGDETIRPRFRIIRDQIDSPEWQAAIRTARVHSSGGGHYSLMRVFVDDTSATEVIQLRGTKLKELTERYSGGGGEFRTEMNGAFVFLEHINSSRRRDGKDPVKAGSFTHGSSTIWVPEPPLGELGIVGDVILDHCPIETMGVLSIKIMGENLPQQTVLCLGPIVVGGVYGTNLRFKSDAGFSLRLPPGNYKVLHPEYDLRKSRWDVNVLSDETTTLTLERTNARLQKIAEDRQPIPVDQNRPPQ